MRGIRRPSDIETFRGPDEIMSCTNDYMDGTKAQASADPAMLLVFFSSASDARLDSVSRPLTPPTPCPATAYSQ